jgi:hypothetical protein
VTFRTEACSIPPLASSSLFLTGVVGDVYDSGAHQEAPTIVYWRAGTQRPPGLSVPFVPRSLTFAIRSERAGTDDLAMRISRAVWAVNPNLPLSSLLFGISPLDPVTYTGVPIILAMAAALASYVAVHRATAVDPVEALKAE